jgi:hypothetical protein
MVVLYSLSRLVDMKVYEFDKCSLKSSDNVVCIVCGCKLSVLNRSESPNVCRECLHSLEF